MAKRSVGDKIDVQKFGYERKKSGLGATATDSDRRSTISYGDGENKKTIDLSVVITPEMEVKEVNADGKATKLKPTGKSTTIIYDCGVRETGPNRPNRNQTPNQVNQANIDNGTCKKIASKTINPNLPEYNYNEETNNIWIIEEGADIDEDLKNELEAGGATTASESLSKVEKDILLGDSRIRKADLNGDDPEKKAFAEAMKEKNAVDETKDKLTTANSNGLKSLLNTKKERRDGRYTNSDGIRFPLDLNASGQKQDYIKFEIYEYSPRKLSATNAEQVGIEEREKAGRGKRSEKGIIILPIPGNIQDSNGVEWSKGDINPLQAELAAAALGLISGGENLQGVTDRFVEKVRNNTALGDARTATANFFTARATRTKGLLSRATGSVINPNSELLFRGPKLRTFNFSYELSARDALEAKAIVSIIRAFKQASSVQKSATRIFLGAPCTFTIKYMNGVTEEEHKYIGKIKECALTNVAVNYAPAQYSTYVGGYMTKYNLTLQFQELEPVHNSDYNDDYIQNNADSIGY